MNHSTLEELELIRAEKTMILRWQHGAITCFKFIINMQCQLTCKTVWSKLCETVWSKLYKTMRSKVYKDNAIYMWSEQYKAMLP